MKKILYVILTLFLFIGIAFATITNTEQPPKQYTANGITTNFPITFDYIADSDLTVQFVNDSDGSIDTWVQDAVGDEGYTIVNDEVVANTAPDDGTLVIDGETPATQFLDLKNNRATPAELYESALDKVTLIARDNKALIDRAPVAPATADPDVDYTLPEYDASKFWQWHPTLKQLRNAEVSGTGFSIGIDIGDIVELIDDGSGNAAFPAFPLSGPLDTNSYQINESIGANIASASALPILTDGNYYNVTGTTNIDNINTSGKLGTRIVLNHVGILDLNYDATDLICLTGATITTAAGDISRWREYASGDWIMTGYERADGSALTVVTPEFLSWCLVDQSGTQSILDSRGIDSITDGGAGITLINFTVDFGNTTYVGVATNASDSAVVMRCVVIDEGQMKCDSRASTSGTLGDTVFQAIFIGDK